MNDAGKVGSYTGGVSGTSDGGVEEGGECRFEASATEDLSCQIVEQYKKAGLAEPPSDMAVHSKSFSAKFNGLA